MGNESSVLDKCEISGKHVDVDNWKLSRGTFLQRINETIPISLFEKKLGENACKLEVELCNNAIRCLKIYRHPSIVKFHASGCKTSSDMYMLTEQVEPLSGLLLQMSPLEMCAGLHSIMSALSFCHEMCHLRHNNLGITSIFVTPNGTWKVAGMEFACLFDQYTEVFRQKNRSFRIESLIPPEERNEGALITGCGYAGDVFAMGLLIEKLLEDIVKSASLPGVKELVDFVKKDVLISDPTKRPTISKLLEHSFFQNDFIYICTFLKQITLKSKDDKQTFFQELTVRLQSLPEELVASRLVESLLSRFVLMDPFADRYFLLNFLKPSKDQQSSPIISLTLYKKYVIPHLIRIFEVHDQAIRIILLKYFEFYAFLIEANILKEKILPEVLLSVKDKNNDLVIFSLKALAFLVPLLGSDIVIGGQRLQYFSESIPKTIKTSPTSTPLTDIKTVKEISPSVIEEPIETRAQTETVYELEKNLGEDISEIERSSPDGSESSRYQNSNPIEDNDWLDWDNQNPIEDIKVEVQCAINNVKVDAEKCSIDEPKVTKGKTLGEEFDIMALEIKNQDSSELDFFADMQPKISANVVVMQSLKGDDESCDVKSKIFAIIQSEEETAEGWDDL